MDFNHCDMYNHLLTRKCTCGGDPEMIIDFVADFEVRCSKCHLSTHAYIKPEDAVKHWNDGDDIMEKPLHIFWDDPEGYLQSEVVAIHISDDGFWRISHQSCDFDEAVGSLKYVGFEAYLLSILDQQQLSALDRYLGSFPRKHFVAYSVLILAIDLGILQGILRSRNSDTFRAACNIQQREE